MPFFHISIRIQVSSQLRLFKSLAITSSNPVNMILVYTIIIKLNIKYIA